jgi:glycine hydroxymethyltransferase
MVGNIAAIALEAAGIVVNRNSVPHDSNPPFYPSGIRLGTPAITSRGMKENEMKIIGGWIVEILNQVSGYNLPDSKEKRADFLTDSKNKICVNEKLAEIKSKVKLMCQDFPIPGINY